MARLGMSYFEAGLIERGVDIDNPMGQSDAEEIVTESPLLCLNGPLVQTEDFRPVGERVSGWGSALSVLEFAYDNASAAKTLMRRSHWFTPILVRPPPGSYAWRNEV
jgi:hypothetical protein